MSDRAALLACRECDLLQRECDLPHHRIAECARCGAELFRAKTRSLDHTLAYVAGAAILFLVANAFPVLSLEAQGLRTTTTVLGAAQALYDDNEAIVAILVFMTTMLLPGIEIAAMLYMLGALRLGRVPIRLSFAFRLVEAVKPWGMQQVFLIGVLVSLVKLGHMASVILGIGLYAMAGVILMLTAAEAAYDPRALWARVRELRR
ncbi:MAG TPA: paraquat-inducible protein A [Usitatibacter sp.]|jgi:paraquat-inducible protein A|nr:paraquat-inducible protein A [Usitatibacter sp.]